MHKTRKNKIKLLKTDKTKSNKSKKTKKIYTTDEYASGDGMLTTVWGPSLWHFLHIMSFNYPVKPSNSEKKYYMNFILNLKNTLPCKYCRINLETNFKQMPLTLKEMESRDTFSRYIFDLHELINKMLKKKSNLLFCDVRERYEHFRARCTLENSVLFKIKKSGKVKTHKREKGCTEPLYGKKSKCVIKIVPQDKRVSSFQVDKKCVKKRE